MWIPLSMPVTVSYTHLDVYKRQDLATYAGEAKNILRDLQSRNERMFLMTFLVVNFADSKQKLENDLLRAASVAQKYNCSLVRLDFQQEDGFVSALPLGVNLSLIHILHTVTKMN